MIGDLLLYKHKGLYDLGIEWLTRSEYTHVATDIGDGYLIEAYPGIGVRKAYYTPKDPEMFRFRVKDSDPKIYAIRLPWLEAQIGKSYDWSGIYGVATNNPDRHNPKEWFCSELAIVYQEMCGYQLIKRDERLVAPGDLAASPLIYQVWEIEN